MKGCRSLSFEEVDKLLFALKGERKKRDVAMILLGVCTGFRISELLSMRVGDVYRDGRVLDHVYVARTHVKGKIAGRSAMLPLSAREALEEWIAELSAWKFFGPDTFLFFSRNHEGANKPIRRGQAHTIITRAAKVAGLSGKIATHSMRKTYAHDLFRESKSNLILVCKALGHTNVATTAKYLTAEIERVNEMLGSIDHSRRVQRVASGLSQEANHGPYSPCNCRRPTHNHMLH